MKFLLDQDVYATTARFLSSLGHDVVLVAQLGLSRAQDEELLQVAQEQSRLFVTRDRDFGHLVFVKE
jgi:predicted nuclease of predicted toxin-antitoxin system